VISPLHAGDRRIAISLLAGTLNSFSMVGGLVRHLDLTQPDAFAGNLRLSR
jgi:hypothetical protein